MTIHTTSRGRRWLRFSAIAAVSTLALVQVIGWFTPSPQVGHFRSADDRRAYADSYDQALALLPTPTRTLDVETAFGSVRAYEWLNPEAEGAPVVLLPGRGSGVPMWSENMSGWLKHRTIYAFDAIGDAGKSTQSAPLNNMEDQASWINEVLVELKVNSAHLVGHSFGAASAAALTVYYPERVSSLALLEPAVVFSWPPVGTLLWSIPAFLPFLPQSWRDGSVAKIAGENPAEVDSSDPIARMVTLGVTGYSAHLPMPKPLSDEQLRSLKAPVYTALAENSSITRGASSLPRAELIGEGKTQIWPGTTHSLPMQVAEPLAEELGAFWKSTEDQKNSRPI